MELEYVTFQGIPEGEKLTGMVKLHKSIFGESYDLIKRMQEKQALYVDLALEHQQVVGYKMGYALNREQFYSWLGGVDKGYRKRGIASTLMERQHRFLKEKGYATVRTHTKNKWRSMLILNIQSGFDIIGTYTDKEGEPKIILEKELYSGK
ncbi:GNAT family N-acetyltransferase [Ralstonia pickettii]|nr:GNAT family N-acetyltransferase [Ralstonia pickettii]